MSKPTQTLRRAMLVPALLLGLSLPALAQEAPAATAPPGQYISPEAKAVIDRMTAYMQGLQSFSIQARGSRDEVLMHGYKLQHNEQATITVQRPNKMRAAVSGDLRNREFVYDGAKIVIYSPDDDAYASAPATDSLKVLIGDLLDAGVELPLIDVLYQTAAGTLTENVRNGILIGDADIEGVACDHLAFRQTDADWQLWVEKGARPLPRKIVITTRNEVGDPQFQTVMSWNAQPKLDKNSFTFVPPKDAKQIAFTQPEAFVEGEH
jgi:hypothetical protein